MSGMHEFITEMIHKTKTVDLEEDLFKVEGDSQQIQIAASPIRRGEVQKMIEQGHGIRILAGMNDMKNFVAVWVGDSNSNMGAIHETIATQLGITGEYVPLEKTAGGNLQVTTTAQSFFDDPRQAEDALDHNREFGLIFGGQAVDYSKLGGW